MEVSTRKPYFIEEDDELASIEAGVSSPYMNNMIHHHHQYSGKFHDFRFEPLSHFLDSCFLCKKRIGNNRDIFMYRGDTPFCSEECREEEIKRDETKEKKQSLSSSVKAMRRNEKQRNSSSPSRSRDYASLLTGTVVAA
ncbi:unnamed protein product [Cochlearia groenlandica]